MPRQARQPAESGIYHVMLRGVNRDALFLEDEDCQRFLFALFQAKQASGCLVLAYCLMPNHVHLVLEQGNEAIGISVKRLGVRYAGWFNRKYGRVGHLFQDRFRSQPVEDDAYFITLLRYVWNNPVAAGLVTRPEEFRWSSRRLLDTTSNLVDGARLRQLLPQGDLADLTREPEPTLIELGREVRPGRRPAHSTDDVAELLERACGARTPHEFGRLPAVVQHRAIRELRTRSVSYDQIAQAVGLSRATVQRMQASGAGYAEFEVA